MQSKKTTQKACAIKYLVLVVAMLAAFTLAFTSCGEPTLTGIAVDSSSTVTTEYELNDSFDVDGVKIKATYSDETTKTIAVTEAMVSNGSFSRTGDFVVVITLNEAGVTKTCTVDVVVKDSLGAARAAAIAEVEALDEVKDTTNLAIRTFLAECKLDINGAKDIAEVEAAVAAFKAEVTTYLESIETQIADAKAEVEGYDYTALKGDLLAVADAAKAGVLEHFASITTVDEAEEMATAYMDYIDAMLDTQAIIDADAAELADAIAALKADIDSEALDTIFTGDYLTTAEALKADFYAELDAATSLDEVVELEDAFAFAIWELLSEQGLEEALAMTIEAATATINSMDYSSVLVGDYLVDADTFKAQVLAAIAVATSAEEVEYLLKDFAYELEALYLAQDEDEAAAALAAIIAAAKAEINAFDYSALTGSNTELADAYKEIALLSVDAATTATEASLVVAEFKCNVTALFDKEVEDEDLSEEKYDLITIDLRALVDDLEANKIWYSETVYASLMQAFEDTETRIILALSFDEAKEILDAMEEAYVNADNWIDEAYNAMVLMLANPIVYKDTIDDLIENVEIKIAHCLSLDPVGAEAELKAYAPKDGSAVVDIIATTEAARARYDLLGLAAADALAIEAAIAALPNNITMDDKAALDAILAQYNTWGATYGILDITDPANVVVIDDANDAEVYIPNYAELLAGFEKYDAFKAAADEINGLIAALPGTILTTHDADILAITALIDSFKATHIDDASVYVDGYIDQLIFDAAVEDLNIAKFIEAKNQANKDINAAKDAKLDTYAEDAYAERDAVIAIAVDYTEQVDDLDYDFAISLTDNIAKVVAIVTAAEAALA